VPLVSSSVHVAPQSTTNTITWMNSSNIATAKPLSLSQLPAGAYYRGQFLRTIGLGPGLVLDNLTLECRETFTSAVTCPYHAWKRGKVLISTKKLMKKRGISWNFADLAVRSQRGKSASRSVLTAKRPDLSAQSPTRAQKKPHTAL